MNVSVDVPRLKLPSAADLSAMKCVDVTPAPRDERVNTMVRPCTTSPEELLTMVIPLGTGMESETSLTLTWEGFRTLTSRAKSEPSVGVEGFVLVVATGSL